MKVEHTENQSNVRRRARSAPPVSETPPHPSDASRSTDSQNSAALQALVSSLRGEFAQAGIVPPPKNYAGMRVVNQSDLVQINQNEENGNESQTFGTLDKMRILMVKGILRRLNSPPPEPDKSQVDLTT